MLAVALVRHHPRHGRQRPGCGIREVVPRGLHVAQLAVLSDGREARQRVPDVRGGGGLRARRAEHLVVDAVRLPALLHVVLPAHARVVKEVRQVGPGVGRRVARMGSITLPGDVHGGPQIGVAARRDAAFCAAGRPTGDHVEVGGEAPGPDALVHVILQHVVLGVGPVVRDLAGVVPTDRVGAPTLAAGSRALRRRRVLGAVRVPPPDRPGDEPVHPSAVDVLERRMGRVGAAAVDEVVVVEGADAVVAQRIGQADPRSPVRHRDAVSTWIGPEVGVERSVLLHHDDHVLDLVDPPRRRRAIAQGDRERRERREGDQRDRGRDEGGVAAPVEHLTGDASADRARFSRLDENSSDQACWRAGVPFATCARHHACPSSGRV